MSKLYFILLLGFVFCTFSSCMKKLERTPLSDSYYNYVAPDYSLESNWIALPNTKDNADHLPNNTFTDNQANADTDVFFLYPTLFWSANAWNAEIENKKLNYIIRKSAIQHQASVFNGSCKVYAPKYRMATLNAFFSDDPKSKDAFEFAYKDVRAAFLHYLYNLNNGQNIVLAGHSQGSSHIISLIKEFENLPTFKEKFVVAYIVGMPVYDEYFAETDICKDANETDCYCTWSTFTYGYETPEILEEANATNPLNWKADVTYAPKELNLGGLKESSKKIKPQICDAQVRNGMVWVRKPNHWLSKIFKIRNLHFADYNLFWVNIRKNVADRIAAFNNKKQSK